VLDVSKLEIYYVTNDAGDKTAVILKIDDFNELLEDIEDLAALAERREESSPSQEQLLAKLKREGLPN